MAVLDLDDVKSGKVVPKAGDVVNGYAYSGTGDPTKNSSYTPLTGQDYLSGIPANRARAAMAVLSGRAPYPSLSRMNPANQQLRDDVLGADENFDATAYDARKKLILNMTSGDLSKTIRALNQAPQHMLSLAGAYDKLNNGNNYQFVNNALTDLEAGAGNFHNQADARGQFNAAIQPVGEELNTVFTGKAATVEGARGQRDAFPMGAGPAESNSALATTAELLMDRLNTIDTQLDNGLGVARHQFATISPQGRQAIYQLYARTHPGWTMPAGNSYQTPDYQNPSGLPGPNNKPTQLPAITPKNAPPASPSQLPRKGANRVVNWNDL